MKKNKTISISVLILWLIMIVLLASCEPEPLYYRYQRFHFSNLNVYSQNGYTYIEGYVTNIDDKGANFNDGYKSYIISSNTNQVEGNSIYLRVGETKKFTFRVLGENAHFIYFDDTNIYNENDILVYILDMPYTIMTIKDYIDYIRRT